MVDVSAVRKDKLDAGQPTQVNLPRFREPLSEMPEIPLN
jgi:hypothetical protein